MDNTAFQLGRLLSMADTLHREYCVHVRKGSIPPQLIGNALMPAAADNPEDAIDRLRERMRHLSGVGYKDFWRRIPFGQMGCRANR